MNRLICGIGRNKKSSSVKLANINFVDKSEKYYVQMPQKINGNIYVCSEELGEN